MKKMSMDAFLYAVSIKETGSFSKAAADNGITQPALSNAIAKLEDQLGAKLFERSTRGVSVTAFGEQIFPDIEDAVQSLSRVFRKAENWGKPATNELRVGISPVISGELVGALFKLMRAGSNNSQAAKLLLTEANLAELEDSIKAGELDLLLVPSVNPLKNFQHRIVGSERLIAVGETFAETGAEIPIESLVDSELIMLPNTCGLTAFTCDVLAENSVNNKTYQGEATNYRVLEEWAKIGLGKAIIPESKLIDQATPHRYLAEDGVPVEIFYEAVWDAQTSQAPLIEELVTQLEQL